MSNIFEDIAYAAQSDAQKLDLFLPQIGIAFFSVFAALRET